MSDIVLPNMREQQHYGLDLSHEDRALLEKKASTENLLNAAAQQTGKIRKDEAILKRPRAADVLTTMPTLED